MLEMVSLTVAIFTRLAAIFFLVYTLNDDLMKCNNLTLLHQQILYFNIFLGLKHLPQLEFLNFSRHSFRKCVNDPQVLGHLEMSDFPTAKLLQLVLLQTGSRLQANKGGHLFAHPIVGNANTMALQYIGMGVQEVFDFFGEQILAASNDQLLEPAHNLAVAIFAQDELIARFEPTVFADSLFGLLLVAVVAQHCDVAAYTEFATGSERDSVASLIDDLGLNRILNLRLQFALESIEKMIVTSTHMSNGRQHMILGLLVQGLKYDRSRFGHAEDCLHLFRSQFLCRHKNASKTIRV
jgi:hypothetical protein